MHGGGDAAGLCPAPRKGTCPLDPVAYEAVGCRGLRPLPGHGAEPRRLPRPRIHTIPLYKLLRKCYNNTVITKLSRYIYADQ